MTAYEEGRKAYRDGKLNGTNPFPSSTGMNANRIEWFNGWYDEKHCTILKFTKTEVVGPIKDD